jgi:FMN phosphatase YigB (HAD superfamily)
MVGDNIMRDIEGAQSMGMMGVLLCASDRRGSVDSSRYHVIGRLSELEDILAG